MMGNKTKGTLLICWVISSVQVQATVYKCIDENQTIHYQKTSCQENAKETVMDVSETPEIVDYTEQKKRSSVDLNTHYQKQSKNKSVSNDAMKLHKRQCARLRNDYKKAQQEVVRKCKQARDIYCNQDADKIEQTNLNRDIRKTARSYSNKGRPQLYLPKLFRLKQQLKQNGC